MAKPEGWIREEFLRFKRYLPLVISAAEDTNVIPVTITLGVYEKRAFVTALAEGNSPLAAYTDRSEFAEAIPANVIVELVDEATGLRPAAAAFTITETSGGSGSIDTGDGTAFVTATLSDDALHLDITDVAGASGSAIGVKCTQLNGVGTIYYASVTFD